MSVFNVKIANHVIEVNTFYNYTFSLLHDFITDEPADIKIFSTHEDIDQEILVYKMTTGRTRIPRISRIESTVLLRKASEALIQYDTLLMHGAVIGIGSDAIMFTGKSGIGKTTHILKWLRQSPDAYVINGDKPFIQFSERPIACGSPWSGKEELYTNCMVPLRSIVLMERSETNQIKQVPFTDAFPVLFQQVYRPQNDKDLRMTLRLLQKLNPFVSFWRFKCNNFRDDCFNTVYQELFENRFL